MRQCVCLLVGAVTAAVLTGCTSDGAGATETAGAPSPATMTLKVMEFNIEYGGDVVDFAGVPAAIQAASPDVVAIEEGYGHLAKIAAALGWPYYDPRTQVVSKYPLLATTSDAHYNLIEVAPGRVVALANLHLPSAPYGPNFARNGASAQRLVALERRGRLPAARGYLRSVAPLVSAGVPTVMAGDFNTPSYRDWTPATVGLRSQIKEPVPWPVGKAVEGAGFVDSYRAIHADPVTDPGLTWPANRPISGSYNPFRDGDPRDRIDFIYVSGATPTDSVVIGEAGTPGVDITSSPWPSDHRAVMTTMTVTPATPPTIVSVDHPRAVVGDQVVAHFHGDGSPGSRLVVVPQAAAADATPVAESPADGSLTLGTAAFDTADWDPGAYDVVLVGADGAEQARATVWVEASDKTVVTTDRRVYRAGQPVKVAWHGAPGNRWDWVSVYPYHARTGSGNYRQWSYTGSTVDGSTTIDATTHGGVWPLRPGRYTVYFMVDDSYLNVASTDITVVR